MAEIGEESAGRVTQARAGSTVAQLKNDIDSGRTGDKVGFPDPGLSPLGTDDEAGGAPPSPQAIETARAQEGRGGQTAPRGKSAWVVALMIAVCVLVVAAAVLAMKMR